jgi:hypothetical protein
LVNEEVAMQLRHKLALIVLGVIFVVLAVMLGIAVLQGDDTTTDENNSDLKSNSARVVDGGYVPGLTPAQVAYASSTQATSRRRVGTLPRH